MSSKFEFPSVCGYLREQEIILKCVLFTELTKIWGLFVWWLISGKEALFTSEEAISNFINNGKMEYLLNDNEEKYIVGIDAYQNCSNEVNGKDGSHNSLGK